MTSNPIFIEITDTTGFKRHIQLNHVTEFHFGQNEGYIHILGRENVLTIDHEEFLTFQEKIKDFIKNH